MTKKEERSSLNVSVETRNRVLEFIYDLQADSKHRWTQDDVIRYLLDDWEKHHVVRNPPTKIVGDQVKWWDEKSKKWR